MKHGRQQQQEEENLPNKLNHVGGVAPDAGGVDPTIDETLMRLSGGP